MGVFNLKKKKKESTLSAGAVQTSAISKHPYYNLGTYMPINSMSRVYQELKQAVPIIDSAIHKIIRLTGGFHFETGNDTLDLQINSFFDSVNVGGNQQGLSAFISNYLNQLLTFGTAIGEVILNDSGIYALYNSELESIELKRNSNLNSLPQWQRDNSVLLQLKSSFEDYRTLEVSVSGYADEPLLRRFNCHIGQKSYEDYILMERKFICTEKGTSTKLTLKKQMDIKEITYVD